MVEQRLFYLVRHGVTAWNLEMRMQGHTDVPLNAEGRAQAACIGARLYAAPMPPSAVWSSDLSRAFDTAEAIARPLGLTVRRTSLLRETMLGDWEGLTRDEIVARGDAQRLADYLRDSLHHRPPRSETLEAVWDRMLRGLDEIRSHHPSGTVAIVGHGGSLRAVICAALDAPIDSMRHLWLGNASLSIIEELGRSEEAVRRVTLVNDTSHLAGLGT